MRGCHLAIYAVKLSPRARCVPAPTNSVQEKVEGFITDFNSLQAISNNKNGTKEKHISTKELSRSDKVVMCGLQNGQYPSLLEMSGLSQRSPRPEAQRETGATSEWCPFLISGRAPGYESS